MKNIPTNHIFIDSSTIRDEKSCSIIKNIRNNISDVNIISGDIDDISFYLSSGRHSVRRYAIITDDVKKFNSKFISNNIIDTNKKDFDKISKEAKWVLNDFKTKKENNIFFTSDQHFNHGNIIKYCNRPWNSGKDQDGNIIVTPENIQQMNEDMIKRWNSVVGKNDTVYHLGDFALGDKSTIPGIVSRLNGKINLILGNHDTRSIGFYYDCGFNKVYDKSIIFHDYFILSHEPMMFIGPNNCFANIYGHVHNSDNYRTFTKSSCCVCVERWDYTPVELSCIEKGLKVENDNGQ